MFNIENLKIKEQKPIKRINHNYDKYKKYSVRAKKNNEKIFEGNILEAIKFLKDKNNDKKQILPNGVFKCASGYYPKYFGYEWEFANWEVEKENNIFYSQEAKKKLLSLNEENNLKIIVFKLNGKPYKGFENIIEVLEWLKNDENKRVDYKSVINIAKNYNKPKTAKTSKGFIWRFYKDVVIEEGNYNSEN